jgi:hypothetical protein
MKIMAQGQSEQKKQDPISKIPKNTEKMIGRMAQMPA